MFKWVWDQRSVISTVASGLPLNLLTGPMSTAFFEFNHAIQRLLLSGALGPSDGFVISV